jgi:hypothetical protein
MNALSNFDWTLPQGSPKSTETRYLATFCFSTDILRVLTSVLICLFLQPLSLMAANAKDPISKKRILKPPHSQTPAHIQICDEILNEELKKICRTQSESYRVSRFCIKNLALHKYVTPKNVEEFSRCFQLNYITKQIPQVIERIGLCRKYLGQGISAVLDCALLMPSNYHLGLSCLQSFSKIEDVKYCFTSPKPSPIVFECLRLIVDEQEARHCISRVTSLPILHACRKLFFDPQMRQECLDWHLDPLLTPDDSLVILDNCQKTSKGFEDSDWERQRQNCVVQEHSAFLALRSAHREEQSTTQKGPLQ